VPLIRRLVENYPPKKIYIQGLLIFVESRRILMQNTDINHFPLGFDSVFNFAIN
jgi:hypothetical protein